MGCEAFQNVSNFEKLWQMTYFPRILKLQTKKF